MGIRLAIPSDITAIRVLDAGAFPTGNPALEPAAPGELEGGIQRGEVWLDERDGVIVGFIHCETLEKSRYNLVSLVVANEFQGRGFGRNLMSHIRDSILSPDIAAEVTCVTSPENIRMIAILLSYGFIGTNLITDYFGPGKGRIFFHFGQSKFEYVRQNHVYGPLASSGAIVELMTHNAMHVVDIQVGAQGALLDLAEPLTPDPVSLRQTEANSSVGQASGVLAALTFLLGFSFVESDYSIALRLFVMVAVILTVGGMQVYANSTGNMARIGDGNFSDHMKWGNLLLDFGGHYPLVLVLPAVFAAHTKSIIGAAIIGAIVTALLFAYEFSSFSIYRRYKKTWLITSLVVMTCLLPVIALPLTLWLDNQWLWVALTSAVLGGRFAWQARRSVREG